jgi:hypothetical protein
MHLDDLVLDFGREKLLVFYSWKPYSEDPFIRDFGNISGFDLRESICWSSWHRT